NERFWKRGSDGSYIKASQSPDQGATRLYEADEIGRYLGEMLLDPILERISGKRQWIISPDGPLAVLPFEALMVRDKRVVFPHDVSDTQPASTLAFLEQRHRDYQSLPSRKTLLAMGG